MATLADLVKKRRQTGGSITGSLTYGVKERLKEKMDPRRLLNQAGLLTALFPQLKAYKSGGVSDTKGSIDKGLSKLTPPESLSQPILDSIQISSKISAKNSMVLPAMHRDINVMRQNIIKLVKLKGGVATNKADAWFMNSRTMESAYENKYKKTTPTKEEPSKEKEKETDTGALGLIGKAVSRGIDTITTLVDKVVSNLPLIGGVTGAGLGLTSKAAGLLMSPAGLASVAVGAGVYASLPDDVKRSDPVETGDYKLEKPFKDKPWHERALIGKRRTAIQEYIDTAQEMKLGPVFTNEQAYDIVKYWDIEVPPNLIAKKGEQLNKATGSVPEEKKVKAKSFGEFKQFVEDKVMSKNEQIGPSQDKPVASGQPNPKAALEGIKNFFKGPEQVEPKDPFAYKGPQVNPATKNQGQKIDDSTKQIKETQREAMDKPSITVSKETKNSSQSAPGTENVELASVYDSEMVNMFGLGRG